MFKLLLLVFPSVRRRNALVARLRREIVAMRAPRLLHETDGRGELIIAGTACYGWAPR